MRLKNYCKKFDHILFFKIPVKYRDFLVAAIRCQLAKDDIRYKYSSVRVYETGIDDFGFLTDLYTVFDDE